jgi:hypothetical protein
MTSKWRSFAVPVKSAKSYALFRLHCVNSEWIIVTWSIEIDGIHRAVIKNWVRLA